MYLQSSFVFRSRDICSIFCLLLAFLFLPFSVQAVSGPFLGGSDADSTKHPNEIPYESNRTAVQHVLALPSYTLHWASRPLGAGVKFLENNFPNLLRGEPGAFVVYPWLEAGGEKGLTYGLLVLHRDFLNKDHNLRYEMRFGSANNNDFDFEYMVPNLIGRNSSTELSFEYGNDSNESFFNGNDVPLSQETEFSEEIFEAELVHIMFRDNRHRLIINPKYRNVFIREGFDLDEEGRIPFPDVLKGRHDILSLFTSFKIDRTRGRPRSIDGYRFLAELGINQSANVRDITYLNYRLEWQEFIPLPFLPQTRRLAFRGFLDKVENLDDRPVPFFDRPALGDSRTLRGFDTDRVRDDGALHATLEYRYPAWDFLDVTVFLDEGQVFNEYGDIALDDFRTSYGFGFHVFNQKNISIRSEFGFSKETSRAILTIGGNF